MHFALMDLEDFALNEVSQIVKDKYHLNFTYTQNLKNKKTITTKMKTIS